MLDRIKKKQYDGFKEFVQNMEVTAPIPRGQIFFNGLLDDPVFMSYVTKNIRTFDDFLELPSDEIEKVLKSQSQMLSMLAKSLYGVSPERVRDLEKVIPRFMSQLRDELGYLTELKPEQQDSAKFFIMKATRKLQHDEHIYGFRWNLPPQGVFYPKSYPDGKCQIQFENGVLAAEGEILKNKRLGFWRHYYETGKVLAEGEYSAGIKNGTWVIYHGNGTHKAQGKYKADQREGTWKEWDRLGNMVEVDYLDGVRRT
jgi:hypothetical protein